MHSNAVLVKQRIVAAIRGAFIADAGAMGTHWIYNPTEMLKEVPSVEHPEFKTPPTPRFYSSDEFPGHYQAGMLSPYGEQLLFVTEHVASTTDLQGDTMSEAMLQWANSFGGRQDHALQDFIKNMETGKNYPDCGADDDQAHIYMKIVPVVGRYAGTPELIDKVTLAIRVHQNNDKAIVFGIAAARLLEAIILGAPLQEALETVEKNIGEDIKFYSHDLLEQVLKAFARGKKGGSEASKSLSDILKEVSNEMMAGKEDSQFYDLAARSCALPGSFIGPIVLFYKYANTQPSKRYEMALRENILASGDTCSRAVFIGAVLAAAASIDPKMDGIPIGWVNKMEENTLAKIDTAISSIAK